MKNAEQHNLLADSQYGGRAQRQAQSAILNKTLIYDILRTLAKDFTSVDEDLKANFDRELSHLGALEDRYYGNSHAHREYLFKTTTNQKFHVKTSFGISPQCYQYNDTNRIWGLGQGMGWSGARWLLTSSTIDRIMNSECSGVQLSCPHGKANVSTLMRMFVDDAAQLCNSFTEPHSSIMEQTQSNLQLHSDLVNVTGGRLAHDKCKFYYIKFVFDRNGNARKLRKHENPTGLMVVDSETNEVVSIKHLDVTVPHKTLGYYLSPDGCQEALYDILFYFASKWASSIKNSSLRPNEIILSYYSVLIPQITYRLAAASLSFQQCDKIMEIIYPVLLNAHGLPISFPRDIAAAPFMYGGLNIVHLYDMQGKENIKFLTLHIKRMDTAGQLMLIHLKYTHVLVGMPDPFQKYNFEKSRLLVSNSWLANIWEYISQCNTSFDLTEDISTHPQREHDRCIIEVLYNHFSLSDLCKINKYEWPFKSSHWRTLQIPMEKLFSQI